MKKILCAALIIGALVSVAPAKIITHGIGLRIGGATEMTYQEYTGPDNRIEYGLGGGAHWFFGLSVVYKWNWKITEALRWYAGPGAQFRVRKEGPNGFGIGGQAGLECDLNTIRWPFIVSFDTRPMVGPREDGEEMSTGLDFDFGLSIRYSF